MILSKKTAELEAKVKQLEADMTAKAGELTTAQEELKTQGEELAGKVEALGDAETKITELNKKIEALEKTKTELEAKGVEIDKEIEAKAEDKAISIVAATGTPVIDKPVEGEANTTVSTEPNSYREFSAKFAELSNSNPTEAGAYFAKFNSKFFSKK